MKRPQCTWVQKYNLEAEAYALTCRNSVWELGKVVLLPRRRGGERYWRAFTYLVEGTKLFESRDEAQRWVLEQVEEEFAKLTEHDE
jgi:hypothetical protein